MTPEQSRRYEHWRFLREKEQERISPERRLERLHYESSTEAIGPRTAAYIAALRAEIDRLRSDEGWRRSADWAERSGGTL